MDPAQTKILEVVDRWLREFIIKFNICPFAKTPYEHGQVRLSATLAQEFEEQLLFFAKELEKCEKTPGPTTLAIFAHGSEDFESFLDFVAACEALRDDLKSDLRLKQQYQLIAFHPKFKFEGADEEARANWVNRSPYPLIHILSEEQIAKAVSDPHEGERISMRNEEKLNSLDSKIASLIKKLHSRS